MLPSSKERFHKGAERKSFLASALRRRPLSFQLFLLVMATALPLLAVSWLLFSQLVQNEQTKIRQGLLTSARTLAALVDNEIATHIAVASTLGHSPALQQRDWQGFETEARNAMAFLPGSWLTVSDREGNVLLNTRKTAAAQPLIPDGSTRQTAFSTGQPQLGNVVLDPLTKHWMAFVAVPIRQSGEPEYLVSVSIPSENILNLFRQRFAGSHIVAVIDAEHRFVARMPDQEQRAGTLAAQGWRDNIAKAPEGFSENISVEGKWILTGYTPTRYGWTVGVAELQSNLSKPLNDILFRVGVMAALLLLLSLGLAWWLARRASTSLSSLASAAKEVGEGHQVPPIAAGFREADVIATALRKASAELQSRASELSDMNARLELEVADRTQDLLSEMKRREDAEATLRQSQRLESIGQLTGGIAHDFNNMLTVVLGNLDIVQRRLKSLNGADVAPILRPLEASIQGGHSAAKLTHRLLAFARQQPLAPTPLDVRALVASLADMITRTVGENVQVETVSGAGLWMTMADAHQLENALVNLVVNARDAMPEGGHITIETGNAYLDEVYAERAIDIKAGQYVMLSVSDTGEGIPATQLEKVFEPFFTTKAPGKGTGLGLAMVHGFVKQSGGHIRVYSEVGHGTTVKIYLPRLQDQNLPPASAEILADSSLQEDHAARAGETILLVEDDPGVRDYATGVVEELGYQVLAAADGEEAMAFARDGRRIDLLFTDVVLRGKLNGRQLAAEVTTLRPGLPVLYTTGYTRNAIVHHGRLDADVNFLSKPYSSRELSRLIRRLLDARNSVARP